MKQILLLSMLYYFTLNLTAQTTINVSEAGKLSEIINANSINLDTLTRLKISGVVDKRDFQFLRHSINSLTSIDMSDLNISSYSETIGDKTIIYNENSIPSGAFLDFEKLHTVIFPVSTASVNPLVKIGNQAFKNTALSELHLPSSLAWIGIEAFQFCNQLNSIYIPDNVSAIFSRAFSDCNLLAEIIVSDSNEDYASYNGVLISKNLKKLYQYPAGKIASSFVIPSDIREIGISAFDGCLHLKNLTFPDTILRSNDMSKCKSLESIKVNYVHFLGFHLSSNVKSIFIADTKVPEWGNWIYKTNIDLSKITLFVRPELIPEYKQSVTFGPDFNYIAWVPTSVDTQFYNKNEILIVPNSVRDYFTIQGLEKSSKFSIYDMSGKLVYSGQVVENEPINVSHLKKGVYVLSAHLDNFVYNIKLYKL